MNICIISGRLGRTPEIKTTTSGAKVTTMSLAVNRKNKDGQKLTDWIDCTAWGKVGEIISQYCKTGDEIEVVGSLQTRTWDKQDGTKGKAVFVLVDKVEFKGTKSETAPSPDAPAEIKNKPDEMPFEI